MNDHFRLINVLKKDKNCNPLLDHSEGLLKVKLLSKNGMIPVKGSKGAAGYDLYSAESKIIQPGARATISLDIAIELPPCTYGQIAPRSSLTLNRSIDIGAGIIDGDYRGNVRVVLINNGTRIFQVLRGLRIAQLLVKEIRDTEIQVVRKLTKTERGEAGFGSSNKQYKIKN